MHSEPKTQVRSQPLSTREQLLGFAHDLRNPLAAIQNAVDVIRLDPGMSQDSSSMLAILDRQLVQIIKLVANFSEQAAATDQTATEQTAGENTAIDQSATEMAGVELDTPVAVGSSFSSIADWAAVRKWDILVVDDTRLVAHALGMMLKKLGQSVRTVSNGESALTAMLERMPDLVFSDIQMLGMSGHELATRIRQMPLGQRVRLIALSGSNSLQDQQRSKDAGFDEHIEKPMSVRTLQRVLNG